MKLGNKVDVTVVGAGIIGLANAWMAARRGLSVRLVERSSAAQGASVRNFGMIWPIGQTAGENYSIALRSRDLWLQVAELANVSVESCGSIHAAHHEDEMATLEEFSSRGTHETRLLTASETLELSPLVQPNSLQGSLYSPTELRVNPRKASADLAKYLGGLPNVDVMFNTTVAGLDGQTVQCGDGSNWQSDRVVVCGGSDLATLYPNELADCGLKRCKLQMFSVSSPEGLSTTPHVASGLTLRHYKSFEGCGSLDRVRKRVASESPELDEFGIHVMASPQADGHLILGDSHEYDQDISPFDKEEIEALMVRELQKVIRLEDWSIRQRWHGEYMKHPEKIVVQKMLPDQHALFTGVGGAGMTLSFGLAEDFWNRWVGGEE